MREVLLVDLVEVVAALDLLQVCVCTGIDGALRFDDRDGKVGAMVGDALVVCEQVSEDKAHFYRAVALLQTGDVARTDLGDQLVDDLLERLDLSARHGIRAAEALMKRFAPFDKN